MTAIALPHNIDAERLVVAAALRHPETLDTSGLSAGDFYLASHQQIVGAIASVRSQPAQPFAVMTVASALRQAGFLDAVGGMDALFALEDEWRPSHETEAAIDQVRALALRRSLIVAGGRIAAAGYDERADIDTQLADAQATLTAVSQRGAPDRAQPIRVALDPWMDALLAGERDGLYTPTGLTDLDSALCGGLWRGDLLILAARPGVGKSALALSIAHHVTLQGGVVPWFSLEMPRDQVLTRLMAVHTGIDSHRLRMRTVRREDLPILSNAVSELRNAPLILDDTSVRTLAHIRAGCLKARNLYGQIAAVVVDYLGLVRATERYAGQRVNEVGEISRGLKALAMELDAPILALHQLSRAVEGRQTHVPMLSDLRDSGNVEQDADSVLFIYREELYDENSDKIGVAEVHIAKQRNGPLGVIPLRFDRNTTRFTSVSYRTVDGYDAPPPPREVIRRPRREPVDGVNDPTGLLSETSTDTRFSAFSGSPLTEDDRWD